MDRTELVFIPAPGAGHLAPMVELARSISNRDDRLSITVFIMNFPFHSKLDSYTQSLLSSQSHPRIRFIKLHLDDSQSEHLRSKPPNYLMFDLVEIHKSQVQNILSSESTTHKPSAFVVDMFCLPFVDVATEFEVPTYMFFTCNVGFLSLMFHLQSLEDDHNRDISEFKDSETELRVPGFKNPVPSKVVPYAVFDKDSGGSKIIVGLARSFRKIKGILVNSFHELESYAIKCLSEDETIPPIFTVGPMVNLKVETSKDDIEKYDTIIEWLDNQPPASVVFLCFGSRGTFESEQVAEIARALEHTKHRFLWSVRRPPPKGKMVIPTEYEDLNEVLPEGFLERTKEVGKVIGWAPQVAVLFHPAVGGFVSHCGWNSTLESLWCDVPIATWPLYAEQQINAFMMVKELGLAVEIKLDYHKMEENQVIVTAEEIETGMKKLMEGSESREIREKVKAISEKSRMAVVEGGSSFAAIGEFIKQVVNSSVE